MRFLFHHLLDQPARHYPDTEALRHAKAGIGYQALRDLSQKAAAGLIQNGLSRGGRVAIFLPKQIETVAAFFAASRAGAAFVPVNPVLKPAQVGYILDDSEAEVLITNRARAQQLKDVLDQSSSVHTVVIIDGDDVPDAGAYTQLNWSALTEQSLDESRPVSQCETDMAAILYTSGSTGRPKGVVLSHRNLVVGADSVSSYLENDKNDKILALLPLSFDAGLSQITTAFASGATCVLLDYLLPNDVLKTVQQEQITGITAVPPLWHQIATLKWNPEQTTLRYFANTGGHMPRSLLDKLRTAFPKAKPYLMYGLTESFRSTYLDPHEVDSRPDSIGKAIPNAEVLVLREDGTECEANEDGELVHCGPLVSQGYWKDTERTAQRFRPIPKRVCGQVREELAVWSGDRVRRDEAGYLYFVARQDEMIKTSGYRVSPNEIEELAYSSGEVTEAVAMGVPHPTLGQAIVLVCHATGDANSVRERLLQTYQTQLPNFMMPKLIVVEERPLPRNPNGKFDRNNLSVTYREQFL